MLDTYARGKYLSRTGGEMALELGWIGQMLKWGPWVVAEVGEDANRLWRYRVGLRVASDPYQSISDCMQDAEIEVRRIFAEQGVSVEPGQ
jgi:hypothetical protein